MGSLDAYDISAFLFDEAVIFIQHKPFTKTSALYIGKAPLAAPSFFIFSRIMANFELIIYGVAH